MGTWKSYIEELNQRYTGKKVEYNGKIYNIAMVDYNGIIHIDLPTQYTKTNAVYLPHEADKHIVD